MHVVVSAAAKPGLDPWVGKEGTSLLSLLKRPGLVNYAPVGIVQMMDLKLHPGCAVDMRLCAGNVARDTPR